MKSKMATSLTYVLGTNWQFVFAFVSKSSVEGAEDNNVYTKIKVQRKLHFDETLKLPK